MELRPIGYFRSCYLDKFGTPRQPHLVPQSRGSIVFQPWVQPEISLFGLSEFSHIWVIFWFHKNQNQFHAKVHPPRLEGHSRGVFSTRSPHRPNPLGLSALKIESIADQEIFVSGLDLVDGTPVLDIKPYINAADSIQADQPDWVLQSEHDEVIVNWDPLALEQLSVMDNFELKILIENTLKLDPRPTVYKTNPQLASKLEHAVRIMNADIHFQFLNPKLIWILRVVKIDIE